MQLLLLHGAPHGDFSQKCSSKIWKPSQRASSKFKKLNFKKQIFQSPQSIYVTAKWVIKWSVNTN